MFSSSFTPWQITHDSATALVIADRSHTFTRSQQLRTADAAARPAAVRSQGAGARSLTSTAGGGGARRRPLLGVGRHDHHSPSIPTGLGARLNVLPRHRHGEAGLHRTQQRADHQRAGVTSARRTAARRAAPRTCRARYLRAVTPGGWRKAPPTVGARSVNAVRSRAARQAASHHPIGPPASCTCNCDCRRLRELVGSFLFLLSIRLRWRLGPVE